MRNHFRRNSPLKQSLYCVPGKNDLTTFHAQAPLAPQTRRILFVVVEEAEDVVFLEAVAAFEEVEFDGEGEAGDFSA